MFINALLVTIENELKHIFKTYAQQDNTEIEIRLGWKGDSDFFNSDIGKFYYDEIYSQLSSCNKWTLCKNIQLTDVYFENIRYQYIDDKLDNCIKKTRLFSKIINLPNTPFDLKLSVCKEQPISQSQDNTLSTFKCKKYRKQFIYKNLWSYDLSIIKIDDNFVLDDTDIKYQFEIEYIHDMKYDYLYLSKSLVYKIFDIINIPLFKST